MGSLRRSWLGIASISGALRNKGNMHEELKERLKKLENDYNGKEFLSIVNKVKKDRTN